MGKENIMDTNNINLIFDEKWINNDNEKIIYNIENENILIESESE